MVFRLLPLRLLPVTMIVILLLLSAKVVTFARNASDALAVPPQPSTPLLSDGPVTVAPPIASTTSAADVSNAERSLLQDLRHRREQLDSREHALEERDAVLQAAELRLQDKIEHLAALQARLDELDHARKRRQDENWSGLVKVYETMKPRDAAAIFDVLDMHVLLGVLDRMNERKAAGVLAAMQPERARLATQMLAQSRLRQDVVATPLPVQAATGP